MSSSVLLSTSTLDTSSDGWDASLTTVGSPSVELHEPWDVGGEIMLMAYEAQYEAASEQCPAGRWGVGLAFKFAGSNDSPFQDGGPIIVPDPSDPDAEFYSCVAAHPTILQLSNGSSAQSQAWLVYFKAERECDPSDTACERYAGLGQLVIVYDSSVVKGSTRVYQYLLFGPDDDTVLSDVAQDMGYPKAAYANGQYYMAFSQFPDVYLARSTNINDFGTPPTDPVVQAGDFVGWGEDELFSPVALARCDTFFGAESRMFAFPLGRSWNLVGTMLEDVTMGSLRSDFFDFDVYSEFNGPNLSTSDGDPEMRHHDVTTSGASQNQFGVYFSTPSTTTSGNEIRIATSGAYDWTLTNSRRCP